MLHYSSDRLAGGSCSIRILSYFLLDFLCQIYASFQTAFYVMAVKLVFSLFPVITISCACSLLCFFCHAHSVYKLVRSMVHFDWANKSCHIGF